MSAPGKKFERTGGEKTLTVDVRILAATNKDLQQEVKNHHSRKDLFYRISVIPIHLPPLRNRRNDIPLLADHFLSNFRAGNSKKYLRISAEAMQLLLNYTWPGNVRELENSLEHAALLAKGSKIEASNLPASIHHLNPANQSKMPTLAEQENVLLVQILEKCNWNKKLAARNLAISRNTLYLKLKKYQNANPPYNNNSSEIDRNEFYRKRIAVCGITCPEAEIPRHSDRLSKHCVLI